MSENVVTVIGLRDVLSRLSRLKNVVDKDAKLMMSEIAEMTIARILARTMKGKDVEGSAFKPYSPKYALFREEKGLPTKIVDLTVTGMMLSAITYEATKDETRIFFQNMTDSSDTSIPMKASFLNEEREFFAMNAKDREKALMIVERYIKKAKRKKGI